MRRLVIAVFVLLSVGSGGGTIPAWASETTTETTEERPSHERTVETEKEVTETKHSDDEPHYGIISGTVHAVGWVLALPFRIVGGLIRLIF